MGAKHTPGPWSVFDDIDPNRATYGIDGPDGSAVVFFGTSINDGIRRLDDARLIAAAPDLLEALQEMVDGDADAIDEAKALGVPFPEEMLKAYRKAISAIAKATGEST